MNHPDDDHFPGEDDTEQLLDLIEDQHATEVLGAFFWGLALGILTGGLVFFGATLLL